MCVCVCVCVCVCACVRVCMHVCVCVMIYLYRLYMKCQGLLGNLFRMCVIRFSLLCAFVLLNCVQICKNGLILSNFVEFGFLGT